MTFSLFISKYLSISQHRSCVHIWPFCSYTRSCNIISPNVLSFNLLNDHLNGRNQQGMNGNAVLLDRLNEALHCNNPVTLLSFREFTLHINPMTGISLMKLPFGCHFHGVVYVLTIHCHKPWIKWSATLGLGEFLTLSLSQWQYNFLIWRMYSYDSCV